MSNKEPIFNARYGRVSGAVWENQDKEGNVYHSVTFDRSYTDGEEVKNTKSFGTGSDLSNLDRVMFDIKVWLAGQSR